MSFKNSAIFLALTCVLAWSFIPLVSKYGQLHIDSFQFLFWTNVLSAIAVALSVKNFFNKIKTITLKYALQTAVLGFLGCFFYYLCLYYGYLKGNPVQVLVVQYLWPALISIFAYIFLKEKLNRYKIASVILGFIAALIVFTKGNIFSIDFSNISVLFIVFIGAVSFALFSIFSKVQSGDINFNIFLYFFWASLFSFITLMLFSKFTIPNLESFVVIFINGVFINGLSYILWIYALSKADASTIAPLVYISPVLSVVWIALIFGKSISAVNIISIILVILSGLLVTLGDSIILKRDKKFKSKG